MAKYGSDGHVRPAAPEDMVPGAVVRMVGGEGKAASFSDCVVLRETEYGWRLARPYAYAHKIGSSSTVLTGVEEFEILRGYLDNPPHPFMAVLLSTGEVSVHMMGPG